MGNCLKRESSMQWGGDDWSSPVPDPFFASNARHGKLDKVDGEEEEEGLLGEHQGKGFTSSTTSSGNTAKPITEVKIKITKKQLEELLGRVDMKELSVQEVLAQLMNVSDRCEANHRSWRPNLQSIPE